MTPQERQLIDDLFSRLSKLETAPRDPDAVAAMSQGLRSAPNAVYALVQTVLVQDEALKQAHHRIEELEAGGAPESNQSGGFLDSMRDAIFGQSQSHGSVPNVRPSEPASRPVWNSGQVMQQTQSPGQYNQGSYNQAPNNQAPNNQAPYNQGSYGQPYGAPQGPMGGAMGGGGGSFLGTAAAAAAGMVGGSLLLGSFRSMMGGSHQAFGDTATIGDRSASPWSNQSNSDLARDAGINDISASQDRAQDLAQDRDDDNSRSGLFDSASNDSASSDDDHDDMDMDSDDFGNDGGSDDV